MIDKLPRDVYKHIVQHLEISDIVSLILSNKNVNTSCRASIEDLHLTNLVDINQLISIFKNLKQVHFHLYEKSRIRYQRLENTHHLDVKYHIHDSIVLRRFLHFNIDVTVKDFIFPYTYAYLGRFKSLEIDCQGDVHKTLAAEIALRSHPETIIVNNPHVIIKTLKNKSVLDIVELLPDNIRLQWWWLYVL